VNKVITMYLRCLVGDRSRQWLQWLPWVELCYNSSFQSSLKTSSFRVVCQRDPPSMRTYVPGEARLPAVHNQLMERDEFVDEIQDRLEQVQQLYKTNYDRNHRDVEYQVGQWVWLQLLHHPMASLNIHGRGKLGPKYDGPFQVLERVSFVTYKLQLPSGAKLHDVFHVRLIKKYCDDTPSGPGTLPPMLAFSK
jgi:hypothetical protein